MDESDVVRLYQLGRMDAFEKLKEIGIDVDAKWVGGDVVSEPLGPEIVFVNKFPEGALWTLKKGEPLVANVRAAASVEWRVYDNDASTGQSPAAVLTAAQKEPGTWVIDWPGTSVDHFCLKLYVEVRPGVADKDHVLQTEGGKVWRVVGPFEAKAGE